jgi:hypothetical protein
MRTDHFIAWDVHCAFTEMVVMTSSARVTRRERCDYDDSRTRRGAGAGAAAAALDL